jgi:predicted dithiol-disulfide oxidoreductase (DUF899 family)
MVYGLDAMNQPKIVSRDEWTRARKELLQREKEHDRARDALSEARRALPMVKVDKSYVFEGAEGRVGLLDLFGKHRQLLLYHFMFDPTWDEGCKSCSFLADNFDPSPVHLAARDVAFVAVSRAPLAKLQAFEKRMGWHFRWYSSFESDFNTDFHVTFPPDQQKDGEYNYAKQGFPMSEAPGLSVFLRNGDNVYHTYSTYSRGLDHLITTYNYLDLTPWGRQEQGLSYGMEWLRLHDRYDK